MKKYIFTLLFSFLALTSSAFASSIGSTSFASSACGSVSVTITGDQVVRIYKLDEPSNYYITHYTGASGFLCDNGDFRYRATNTEVLSTDLPVGDYSFVIMDPYTGECYDGLSYSGCKATPDFDSEILFSVTAPEETTILGTALEDTITSIEDSAVGYAPNVFGIFAGLVGVGFAVVAIRRYIGVPF